MWPLAVQASSIPGDGFPAKFAFLEQLGFEGIEVSGRDLLEHADALRRASASSPVRIVSACAGFDGWLVDRNPRARNLAIAQIVEMLAIGADLGTAGLVSPAAYGIDARDVLPPFRHAYTIEEDRALLVESLGRVAEGARTSGGTLLLEPLNRYVDRVLNTLAETASVIDEVGSRHVRMVPDLFHASIEEADPAAALEAHAPYVAHVHLSDSNRLLPGRGHTDFGAAFAALRRGGFDGAMAIECKIPGDPETGLRQAREFLLSAMRTAVDVASTAP